MAESQKIFLYVEYQASREFGTIEKEEMQTIVDDMNVYQDGKYKKDDVLVPGMVSKTWLSGYYTHSIGGFYEFKSLECLEAYVHNYLMEYAKQHRIALAYRLFNGDITREANIEMRSPFYGEGTEKNQPTSSSKVFLYVEYQANRGFETIEKEEMQIIVNDMNVYQDGKYKENGVLVPSMVSKTWLSGYYTRSIGGFYEFKSREGLEAYVHNYLMQYAKDHHIALTYRFFDGDITKDASIAMRSPFYQAK